jgi:hypothetical protein
MGGVDVLLYLLYWRCDNSDGAGRTWNGYMNGRGWGLPIGRSFRVGAERGGRWSGNLLFTASHHVVSILILILQTIELVVLVTTHITEIATSDMFLA